MTSVSANRNKLRNDRLLSVVRHMLLQILLLLPFYLAGQAELIPPRPSPQRLVNNLSKEFPSFFSPDETERLELKLREFSNSSSNQIVIVVVDDLNGMEAWSYATELGQKWGVGQEKFDNGAVILIKPTGGEGQRDIYIAVGYGLESAIPDLTARRIVEEEIMPYFSQGRFYEAMDRATNVIMELARGDYNHETYSKKGKNKIPFRLIILILIIIFIIIFSRRGGGGMTIGRRGTIFGPTFGGGHWGGGGWGGFGGGSSGGGWGGFGGGGFGGGGSGGKW